MPGSRTRNHRCADLHAMVRDLARGEWIPPEDVAPELQAGTRGYEVEVDLERTRHAMAESRR